MADVGVADRDGTVARDCDATYRTIALRLMPLLILCYVVNYIDRTNIGISQLQFRTDLGFSEAVYGIGVGLFFVGFILFEVPSNILLDRIGARRTLLRIMVLWGLVSICTMFVTTPWEFYAARILLGAAEAGFFPGILLYLTYWFPSARRTRMTALFFLGLPLSGIVGSPLSGWILHTFPGVGGLHAWQWMFLLEGIPSVLLGAAVFAVLDDRPGDARWLSPVQKAMVMADLAAEQSSKQDRSAELDVAGAPRHGAVLQALRDPRVYVLGLVGCGTYTLANTVSFWSPLLISQSGVNNVLDVGLLGAIAPLVGIVACLVVGAHSDRTLERRWHAACSEFVAAGALVALAFTVGRPYLTVALITLMTVGHYCGLTVFWSVPSVYLSDRAKAGGIAVVTAIGSTAAALSPAMLGWIRVSTGSLSLGLLISAGIITLGGVVLLVGVPARLLSEQAVS
jgi:D-galactonate transporter